MPKETAVDALTKGLQAGAAPEKTDLEKTDQIEVRLSSHATCGRLMIDESRIVTSTETAFVDVDWFTDNALEYGLEKV